MKTSSYTFRRNKGNVLIMTALSLFVIIGMAGLAIDSADSFSNLTRLQTSTDAAALAAAQKLLADVRTNLGSPVAVDAAIAAGRAVYQANLDQFQTGTRWLPNTTSADIDFCFSRDLQDFSNCVTTINWSKKESDEGFFVKATVASTSLPNILMQAVGLGPTRSIGAVAVAGTICPGYDCGLAPFFICDNTPAGEETDDNCSDGSCFGQPVTLETDTELKSNHFFALKTSGPTDNPPSTPSLGQTESDCNAAGAFETDGCLLIWDKRDADNPLTTWVDEADPAGYPFQIVRNQNDWNFNPSITLNGDWGYLDLLNAEGESGNSGKDQMKTDLLSGNACLNALGSGIGATTEAGSVESLDQAFNGLFGEPGGKYATNASPLKPIENYADFVAKLSGGGKGPLPPDPYQPISFNYYHRLYSNNASWGYGSTQYHQRLRPVPVLKCPNPLSGTQGGPRPKIPVAGYACFFFNREVYLNKKKGILIGNNESSWVIAEHVDNKFCPTDGIRSTDCVLNDPLRANIVLFQVVGSTNS
jgi:Flp pilus assembly protein TadG